MNGDLPQPLTPVDCDLRSYPFMPLMISRLRRSKSWLSAKRRPELGFYMVNLWTASWHDFPAASLEDDDDVLADLAMCDPFKWGEVRDAVLHGWVKCADGRLYHPVVAEQANGSWASKQGYRDRLQKARHAKAQKAEALSQAERDSMIEPVIGPIASPMIDPVTGVPLTCGLSRQVHGQVQDKAKLTRAHASEAEATPRGFTGGLEQFVTTEASTGRQVCGRWYLQDVIDRVYGAACIDNVRWKGNYGPVIKWLHDGVEPNEIVAAIERCAKRDGYRVPDTLNYFDKPVLAEVGKRKAH